MQTIKERAFESTRELDDAIDRYHEALREFVKGNPEPQKSMFSHRDDVILANPLGPPRVGWQQVSETLERAASLVRDGEVTRFENVARYVTRELAFIVELEWAEAKIAGASVRQRIPLRVTTIFRPEDGTWKVMHRHADNIVSPRPIEAVVQP